MTDRAALLRAVAAHPDDDTPRLIYADLLDESGGDANAARARFIRLQIESHRGPGDTGGTWAFGPKVAEAAALADRFGHEWLHELPRWCVPMFGPVGKAPADLFPRGFVERVRAKAKLLVLRTPELFNTVPVRSLEVMGGATELLAKVLSLEALTRLKVLALRWRGAGDALAEAIAGSWQLFNLWELDLSGCSISERAARILARSDRLPELRVLRMRDSFINSTALTALAASSKLTNLREIDIRGGPSWPEPGAALQEAFPGKWFRV